MSTKIHFLIKSISLVLRVKIRKIEKGFHFEVVMEGEVGRVLVPTIVARWSRLGTDEREGDLTRTHKRGSVLKTGTVGTAVASIVS